MAQRLAGVMEAGVGVTRTKRGIGWDLLEWVLRAFYKGWEVANWEKGEAYGPCYRTQPTVVIFSRSLWDSVQARLYLRMRREARAALAGVSGMLTKESIIFKVQATRYSDGVAPGTLQ